jgi:hypothetical protein
MGLDSILFIVACFCFCYFCGMVVNNALIRHRLKAEATRHGQLQHNLIVLKLEKKVMSNREDMKLEKSAKKFAEAKRQHAIDATAYKKAEEHAKQLAKPAPPVKQKRATPAPLSVGDFERGLKPQVYGWR